MTEEPFLRPKLTGKRFESHSLPLDILKDFAVLEELLIEIAKAEFLNENKDRKKAPGGFSDGVSLCLTSIGKGSTILTLHAHTDSDEVFPLVLEYMKKAREKFIQALDAASKEMPVKVKLPDKVLGYFNRFGRSLQEDEAIEFNDGSTNMVAGRLTRETRRRLLLASSSIKTITDEIVVRGKVPKVDLERMTCEIELFDTRRIRAPLPSEHEDVILEALNGYRRGQCIAVKAIGQFSRSWRLQALEEFEQVTLLDPLDVSARLDEFRQLKQGWLEGHGVPPCHKGLDWLSNVFSSHFPEDLPLPYTYPMEDGGVQMEWSLPPIEASLDIDLEMKSAEWHLYHKDTGDFTEVVFDLSNHSDWVRLVKGIREILGQAI